MAKQRVNTQKEIRKGVETKHFSTEAETKEYAKNFGKHQFEHVTIGTEKVILCGTDQAYEEQLWGDAYEMTKDFCMKFSIADETEDNFSDFATDMATQIRDLVLEHYEKEFKTRFVDVCEEY